jgi:GT2 family glycosyltransferase
MLLAAVSAALSLGITALAGTGDIATLVITALVTPACYLLLLRTIAREHWNTLGRFVGGARRAKQSREVPARSDDPLSNDGAVWNDGPVNNDDPVRGVQMSPGESSSRSSGDGERLAEGIGYEQGGPDLSPQDVGVVIPAYGRVSMTQELVAQFLEAEQAPTVIVVDNAGDYEAIGAEVVIRPGANLGWLRGTNLGTTAALDLGLGAVMWCNNDVVLSKHFVGGMCAALVPEVGAVAPCYDGQIAVQLRGYAGTVENYEPMNIEHTVSSFDGTCVLVRADVLRTVGLLDEARFARHGWGAIADVALRIRRAGWTVVVTERAFIHHFDKTTAREVNGAYESAAIAEMWLGLREKYGSNWPREFPDMDYRRAEWFPYLRDRWRLRKTT